MAGRVTISAGTWAMPSTSTITASTPAHGIPATSRATPTMMAWMKATPITPWATARMVAVDRLANSLPRALPTMRSKIARLLRLPACPKAMMMPAMMKEARNCNTPPPMLATKPRAVFASSPIFGCMLCTSAGRSAWAFDHTSWIFLPTTGHAATPGRGAGICSVLFCTSWTSCCTESPSELSSIAVGTTISTMPSDDQQGGGQSLLAADLAGEGLVERIERDGQDQRPDHQGQERGEDLVAQHGQARIRPARIKTSSKGDTNRCSSS